MEAALTGLAGLLRLKLPGLCAARIDHQAPATILREVLVFIVGVTSVTAWGEPTQTASLTVESAPSLEAVFQNIIPMFEQDLGVKVHIVYGPSKTRRRQIEKEEPIDVFFSDGVEDVEKLHKEGLTLNGKPRVYAQTSLMFALSAAFPAMAISFHDHDVLRERGVRITVGDPNTSALGDITARALGKLDPAYKNHFSLLYGRDGKDSVNLVRTEKADEGIVFHADAINGGQVRIIASGGTYPPVLFGQAVAWTCRDASVSVTQVTRFQL